MSTVFDIHELSYRYGEKSILADVSLQIEKGKFSILLGRNGSGKSTFMRILSGLTTDYSGSIYLYGKDIADWHHRDLSRTLSYLGQSHKAVFPFRVEDVVLTGRAGYIRFLPSSEDSLKAEEAMDLVDILDLRTRIYTELSGGEQQLVLLARALAQKPEVLLLDEPTNHLDYSNQIQILSLVKRLLENDLTVVCAMHDPNMAFSFGDDFFFISDSTITKDEYGKPWEHPLLQTLVSDYVSVPYGERSFILPKSNK